MEKAVLFDGGRLTGIVCTAEGHDAAQDRPGVVLLNAGLLHRVGPFRFNVQLARACAQLGFHSMRFDLSRIGDSQANNTAADYDASVISDIQACFNKFSAELDIDRFVVIGMCTGADNAHKIAVADERVEAAVFLDGYGYPTPTFYLKRLTQALSSPERVNKVLRDLLGRNAGADAEVSGSAEQATFVWELPPKEQTRTDLQKLIARKVQMYYLYTGGVRDYFNHEDQFKNSFRDLDFADLLKTHCYERADHTYTLSSDRETLVDNILSWLGEKF